jgi:hypothetical protein
MFTTLPYIFLNTFSLGLELKREMYVEARMVPLTSPDPYELAVESLDTFLKMNSNGISKVKSQFTLACPF